MIAFNLNFKVLEFFEGVKSINNYNFKKVNVLMPNNIEINCYISEKAVENMNINSYYKTTTAYLTSDAIENNCKRKNLCVRIDFIYESSKEEFEQPNNSLIKVNGFYKLDSNNKVDLRGPMLTPTYKTYISCYNETKERYYVQMVGFHKKAYELESIDKSGYIDVTGYFTNKYKSSPLTLVVKEIKRR